MALTLSFLWSRRLRHKKDKFELRSYVLYGSLKMRYVIHRRMVGQEFRGVSEGSVNIPEEFRRAVSPQTIQSHSDVIRIHHDTSVMSYVMYLPGMVIP